ncbi:hypothetical protein B7494_g1383 [Chlorociboria aeruginascens]|nr:hypothetical protein B7494_g1383 [Chlorociboria aeruginascens]
MDATGGFGKALVVGQITSASTSLKQQKIIVGSPLQSASFLSSYVQSSQECDRSCLGLRPQTPPSLSTSDGPISPITITLPSVVAGNDDRPGSVLDPFWPGQDDSTQKHRGRAISASPSPSPSPFSIPITRVRLLYFHFLK